MLNLEDPLQTEYVIFDLERWHRDIFDDDELSVEHNNKRKSVRYIRKDLTVFISQPDILGTYSLSSISRATEVKLFDISSRGVLISGPSRLDLKINQTIMLTLIFDSNKMFEFPARIVRKLIEDRTYYGIKFNRVNDRLAEYLLESQSDLVFK